MGVFWLPKSSLFLLVKILSKSEIKIKILKKFKKIENEVIFGDFSID